MSDIAARRRIRAQSSPGDENLMGFVLDHPLQTAPAAATGPLEANVPLGRALLGVSGVDRVEVAGATIWVRKARAADWPLLKPAIAGAIRQVLDKTEHPLGESAGDPGASQDTTLLRAVAELLEQHVNPSVATHGGRIAAEQVENGVVHLRMSGGCQGCAASSATLRQGVERMLRAALPQIREIVDVTDHEAGQTPFHARDAGVSAVLDRAIPPGVVELRDGQVVVDPDYLAPRLGLTPETLRKGLQNGDVVGVSETGIAEDEGSARIVLRSRTRAWAAVLLPNGTAREVPPPREATAASEQERALAARVRAHLEALADDAMPITYGALARALGLWAPGSVRKITRALETTMQEDAQRGLPFIAARAISRGTGGLPGRGFFDLAHSLSRGPEAGESDADFHARQLKKSYAGQETPAAAGQSEDQ